MQDVRFLVQSIAYGCKLGEIQLGGGRNLLHYAANAGDLIIVEFLLQNGVKMNQKDDDDLLPSQVAEQGNHLKIMKMLQLR